MLYQVAVALAIFSTVGALRLPAYITPCSRSDPKFSECATKNGNLAKGRILAGDRKYHFPNMDPLQVTSLVVDDSKGPVGLVISLKDIKIHGFQELVLKNVVADYEKNVLRFYADVPRIETEAVYNMSGKILILPITGYGASNFTFMDFKMDFSVYFELFKKPSGKEHLKITGNKMTFTYSKAHLKFDNLFNGNKALAEQMSNFIDQNSGLLVTELGPPVTEAIASAFLSGFGYMCDKVPFDEIFLP